MSGDNGTIRSSLYTPTEAARYAGLHDARRVRRWLFGNDSGESVLFPFLGRQGECVSFIDLIQMMAVRDIRLRKEISLPKIRETLAIARDRHGIEYPFARPHETFLYGKEVVVRLADGTIIGVTGELRDQHLIDRVVEKHLKDLAFDPQTGLAYVYRPMTENGRSIVLSPKMRLGAPVVAPCGYEVATLVGAAEAEGGVGPAARAYGVDQRDVMLALRYEESLGGKAA